MIYLGTLKKSQYYEVLCIDQDIDVYIGKSNIEHIQKSHPRDYRKYYKNIKDIVNCPDYCLVNQVDGSIELVKEFKMENDFVKIAIRISISGRYFVRSLYVLKDSRAKNFIENGLLLKITLDK